MNKINLFAIFFIFIAFTFMLHFLFDTPDNMDFRYVRPYVVEWEIGKELKDGEHKPFHVYRRGDTLVIGSLESGISYHYFYDNRGLLKDTIQDSVYTIQQMKTIFGADSVSNRKIP